MICYIIFGPLPLPIIYSFASVYLLCIYFLGIGAEINQNQKLRTKLDKLLRGLINVHPSNTDFILKNDQFQIRNGWVNYQFIYKSNCFYHRCKIKKVFPLIFISVSFLQLGFSMCQSFYKFV